MIKSILLVLMICVANMNEVFAEEGGALLPISLETVKSRKGEDTMRIDFFSFKENGINVAGYNIAVKFIVDAPAQEVWPYFKDFNAWLNVHGYYFKGDPGDGVAVPGDMAGQMMRLGTSPNGPWGLAYTIDTVVPNHLIVLTEISRKRDGYITFGDHVFMLTQYDGKTLVTVFMQHASRSAEKTVKQLLNNPRLFVNGSLSQDKNFWLDALIPKLRSLVESGASQSITKKH